MLSRNLLKPLGFCAVANRLRARNRSEEAVLMLAGK